MSGGGESTGTNMIVTEVPNLSRNFHQILLVMAAQGDGDESWAFLGDDSLAWIVLALGAAMVVGNILALLRPPAEQDTRPPLGRTVAMVALGGIAAIWGLASLFK